MRKKGRKLIKSLDVMKYVTLNNLQNRNKLPIGRKIIPINNSSFFQDLTRKTEKIIRITETIMSG